MKSVGATSALSSLAICKSKLSVRQLAVCNVLVRRLVSAICNASKFFLRMRARHVALSPEMVEEPDPRLKRVLDALPDQLAAREAFCCVTTRCQLALRLRYLEGYSVPEVAAELQTTPRYAAKLIARCLRQAHARYTKGTP